MTLSLPITVHQFSDFNYYAPKENGIEDGGIYRLKSTDQKYLLKHMQNIDAVASDLVGAHFMRHFLGDRAPLNELVIDTTQDIVYLSSKLIENFMPLSQYVHDSPTTFRMIPSMQMIEINLLNEWLCNSDTHSGNKGAMINPSGSIQAAIVDFSYSLLNTKSCWSMEHFAVTQHFRQEEMLSSLQHIAVTPFATVQEIVQNCFAALAQAYPTELKELEKKQQKILTMLHKRQQFFEYMITVMQLRDALNNQDTLQVKALLPAFSAEELTILQVYDQEHLSLPLLHHLHVYSDKRLLANIFEKSSDTAVLLQALDTNMVLPGQVDRWVQNLYRPSNKHLNDYHALLPKPATNNAMCLHSLMYPLLSLDEYVDQYIHTANAFMLDHAIRLAFLFDRDDLIEKILPYQQEDSLITIYNYAARLEKIELLPQIIAALKDPDYVHEALQAVIDLKQLSMLPLFENKILLPYTLQSLLKHTNDWATLSLTQRLKVTTFLIDRMDEATQAKALCKLIISNYEDNEIVEFAWSRATDITTLTAMAKYAMSIDNHYILYQILPQLTETSFIWDVQQFLNADSLMNTIYYNQMLARWEAEAICNLNEAPTSEAICPLSSNPLATMAQCGHDDEMQLETALDWIA